MTNEELFEMAMQADEELEIAIGTENEKEAIRKSSEIMSEINRRGLAEAFANYICE